ncbi:MAG: hypothetical protein HYU52_02540 [Acidobacteria bacterium]|nr:hypothetical protein [Acidobacteriota bacterium]
MKLTAKFLIGAIVSLTLGAVDARAQAGDPFTDWNVQLLYGTNYSEPDIGREISKGLVTFENAAGWTWGSSYGFVEVLRSYSAADENATEVYGEWYPSASLRALSRHAPGEGFVRDVSLTFAVNAGTKSTGPQALALLPGVTAELSIPGFRLATLGVYAYVDRSKFEGEEFGAHGTSFQITPSWSVPFKLGRAALVFDGFADYIGEHGELEYQVLAQPQLKIDVSPLWGSEGQLLLGVEWQLWRNKYGVRGLDESVPQVLVLWNP